MTTLSLLESALDAPGLAVERLAGVAADELDAALREFVRTRREAALPVVTALASGGSSPTRRVAKKALYRLAQSGITPPAPEQRPMVERRPERAVRGWLSGIDGTGTRAAWILFEAGYGELMLCSLLLSDTTGIADVAGDRITKRRLEAELASLRASQKLPWVEMEPQEVTARVVEALALHEAQRTSPPAAFARWQHFFDGAAPPAPAAAPPSDDTPLADRAGEMLDLPELMGWFVDPDRVQGDAVRLMEARESRLVLSDQQKTEREEALLGDVTDRELPPEERRRWAHRLDEMAIIFDRTDRPEPAAMARAAAASLLDLDRIARHVPFARALTQRGLEVAVEVASGRLSASDVSRQPGSAPRT
jgi:hypothetical protein